MPLSNLPGPLQRLRLRHTKESALKYISHLDLMRIWERTLRRAAIPIAYSEGFNPRPKIVSAAPLSVGYSSEAELLDIKLARRLPPLNVVEQLSPQLPKGLRIISVEEIPLAFPSLQSQMRQSEYQVRLMTASSPEEIRGHIEALMAKKSIPWQRLHKGKIRSYDLRPLMDTLCIEGQWDAGVILGMRLQLSSQATGRPDDVLEALGYQEDILSIHRTRLIWDD
ncbi:MAG: TIGR03936 family radical SAM-associated protein [Chloroflexota bacterium]